MFVPPPIAMLDKVGGGGNKTHAKLVELDAPANDALIVTDPGVMH